MLSSYRASATMTERDYEKSENARHLSRTVLFMTGSVATSRDVNVMVKGTETADELRMVIASGCTRKIMRQSARRTFCLRVTVIESVLVYYRTLWPKQVRLLIGHYLLLRLHCTSPLVARYMRLRMMMRHLWYRDTYRDTWVTIRYLYCRPRYRDASMYHYDPSGQQLMCYGSYWRHGSLMCY